MLLYRRQSSTSYQAHAAAQQFSQHRLSDRRELEARKSTARGDDLSATIQEVLASLAEVARVASD